MLASVLDLGQRELDAFLTRIGVDAERQEFGGQRAEIDPAVDDRVGRIVHALV